MGVVEADNIIGSFLYTLDQLGVTYSILYGHCPYTSDLICYFMDVGIVTDENF